jgi:Tfp pilus assembly PilM family ATPase
MNSVFSRFFPMPRFMSLHGGGIEISDRSVKYLRLSSHDLSAAHIAAFGEIPLPVQTIVNGEIHNMQALVDVLKHVRQVCGFSFVYGSLPESKGYLFSDFLPQTAIADVQGALAMALSSHVPLAPAEAVYDCEYVQPEHTQDSISIVAAAIGEDLALSYCRALESAGFMPLTLELEPQAAARAVLAGQMREGSAAIIADLGETKTMLCVVEGGIPRFTTSIEGSASLDAAVAATGADIREIIRRKVDVGIVHGAYGETRELLQLADRFAAEISRLAVYWNTRYQAEGKGTPIGNVVLYGGNANIKGLAEYLSRVVRIPVSVARIENILHGTDRVHLLSADQFLRYATVVGLAMRIAAVGPIR